MTQWGWLVLFTLFMAFIGVVAGMVVNTVATLLLDPTCSRGLCDAEGGGGRGGLADRASRW